MRQSTDRERATVAAYLDGEPQYAGGYILADARGAEVQRGTLEEMGVAWRSAAAHDVQRGDGSPLSREERLAALYLRGAASYGSDSREHQATREPKPWELTRPIR